MTTTPKPSNAAARAEAIRRQRSRRLLGALGLWVGVPTLLAILYYGFIAADEYESVAVFTVQTRALDPDDTVKPNPGLVASIIDSREMVESLVAEEQWLDHYQRGGDFLSRLDGDAGSEERFDYYRSKVSVEYHSARSIGTLRVRAYDPAIARELATEILDNAGDILNRVLPSHHYSAIAVSGPSQPTEATYPKALWGIATVFVVALALMGVITMLAGAVREHAKL